MCGDVGEKVGFSCAECGVAAFSRSVTHLGEKLNVADASHI